MASTAASHQFSGRCSAQSGRAIAHVFMDGGAARANRAALVDQQGARAARADIDAQLHTGIVAQHERSRRCRMMLD